MSAFESMLNLYVVWYSRHTHLREYMCMYMYVYKTQYVNRMIDFEEENKTITLTVPTQGSIPVISVQNWIMLQHRVVASGFNWGLSWNDYKNGFGSSNSEDFWLDCKDRGCVGGLLDGSREASPPDDIGQLPSALGMAGDGDSLLVLD